MIAGSSVELRAPMLPLSETSASLEGAVDDVRRRMRILDVVGRNGALTGGGSARRAGEAGGGTGRLCMGVRGLRLAPVGCMATRHSALLYGKKLS